VLTNENGAELAITNYGERCVVEGRPQRELADIVLGYDSAEVRDDKSYFGALVGRYGRIAQRNLCGRADLQAGKNNGDTAARRDQGINKALWTAKILFRERRPVLELSTSARRRGGFPENLKVA